MNKRTEPVPVIIVTGFLGCGKTSFIRKLLPECGVLGIKPTLIINEVGDTDIDGESVSDLYSEQVRLVGGCICCNLQSQLRETIYDLLEKDDTEIIIIECSGLSNPIDVLEALSAPAMISKLGVTHIISVVDAKRVHKILKTAELAESQIKTADVLVLNKIDQVQDDELIEIKKLLKDKNPNADFYDVCFGEIGSENIKKLLTDKVKMKCTCSSHNCSHDHSHNHHNEDEHNHHYHQHCLPESFCTSAFDLPDEISMDTLMTVLKFLPENVIRAKGFAYINDDGWYVMQKVFDYLEVLKHNGKEPSVGAVLICIGQNLDSNEISKVIPT
ncbi:MAG: GTP-binding protein [Armatimonadota bacterium]